MFQNRFYKNENTEPRKHLSTYYLCLSQRHLNETIIIISVWEGRGGSMRIFLSTDDQIATIGNSFIVKPDDLTLVYDFVTCRSQYFS